MNAVPGTSADVSAGAPALGGVDRLRGVLHRLSSCQERLVVVETEWHQEWAAQQDEIQHGLQFLGGLLVAAPQYVPFRVVGAESAAG